MELLNITSADTADHIQQLVKIQAAITAKEILARCFDLINYANDKSDIVAGFMTLFAEYDYKPINKKNNGNKTNL